MAPVPGYLKTLGKAIRELEERDISDKSDPSPSAGTLMSLKSLLSRPPSSTKAFAAVFAALEQRCPDYVDQNRWDQAVVDGRRFLAKWGDQATALGWTAQELFGLHDPPPNPHPSYDRLARYDVKGLVWVLEGLSLVAMTETTASIRTKTGATTTYRKNNKPALGPLGDSLDDFV